MTVTNENLFAAVVLVLAKQIEVAANSGNMRRSGADWTGEALALIRREQPEILRRVQGG